jgi:hypothetical protein
MHEQPLEIHAVFRTPSTIPIRDKTEMHLSFFIVTLPMNAVKKQCFQNVMACDIRASKALAKVLSAKPVRSASVLLDKARKELREALENSCVLERRAVLKSGKNKSGGEGKNAYDAYITSLSIVDDACARLLALEGHLMRARVLAQEADVKAINEAIRTERNQNNKKYQPATAQSAVLAQRLKEAVPLPIDAVSLSLSV